VLVGAAKIGSSPDLTVKSSPSSHRGVTPGDPARRDTSATCRMDRRADSSPTRSMFERGELSRDDSRTPAFAQYVCSQISPGIPPHLAEKSHSRRSARVAGSARKQTPGEPNQQRRHVMEILQIANPGARVWPGNRPATGPLQRQVRADPHSTTMAALRPDHGARQGLVPGARPP